MKTKMKKSILVALMFGTLISYANENNNYSKSKAEKTVKIEFKNVKKGQSLLIKNAKGQIIYNKEIIASGNYSKLFNFSALENGIYTAELNKDFEIHIKKFKVKNGFVTFYNKENKKVYKPVIRNENNKILISKISFNKEPLKVVIYYKDEVIYSEKAVGNNILNRVYSLSKHKTGKYKVVLKSDERFYVKEFTI